MIPVEVKLKKLNSINNETIKNTILEKAQVLHSGVSEEEINSHEHSPICNQGNLKLKVAEHDIIEKHENISVAEKFILEGKYCIQLLGAGAATRLGKGPMFGIDLSSISIPASSHHPLSLGTRHMLQYKTNLVKLARKYNLDENQILRNQTFIVHLNENSAKDCIETFTENNFFGFDRRKILFCIQSTHPALKVESGEIIQESQKTYPYGHGHTLLQLGVPGEAFILDEAHEIEALDVSILEYLKVKGVELISSHRINDLTKISDDSICPIKVDYALKKFDNGSNIAVELVGNPHNQKGGKWLKWEGHDFLDHSFLIEGLNAKNDIWKKAFEELENSHYEETGVGIPYNSFRLMYKIDVLQKLLEEGLTPSLREREDGLTLELTTGDITQNPNSKSVGFQIKDEVIHDFKTLDNLDEALSFLDRQDNDEVFKELVKEYL